MMENANEFLLTKKSNLFRLREKSEAEPSSIQFPWETKICFKILVISGYSPASCAHNAEE